MDMEVHGSMHKDRYEAPHTHIYVVQSSHMHATMSYSALFDFTWVKNMALRLDGEVGACMREVAHASMHGQNNACTHGDV